MRWVADVVNASTFWQLSSDFTAIESISIEDDSECFLRCHLHDHDADRSFHNTVNSL
jgi:hypothetical protein